MTVSIMELREGMCACIVPVEPFPTYCGLPVSRNFRMCQWHGAAYLRNTNDEEPEQKKALSNRDKRRP